MKLDPTPEFRYEISVSIRFTAAELRVVHKCAEMHYDYNCKTFFKSGQTGNGWRNQFSLPPEEGEDYGDHIDPFDEACPDDLECGKFVRGEFDDFDRVAKILEMSGYLEPEEILLAAQFKAGCDEAVRAIANERARIRGEEPQDPVLRPGLHPTPLR